MNILHISWTFTFGGIETMLVNIANEQIKAGHDVSIIVIEHNNIEKTLQEKLDKKIKLYCANRKFGTLDISAIYRLNKLVMQINPDVIHLHSASIYKYILSERHRKICNSTLHDICNKKNTNNISKIPRVFSISETVHDDLYSKLNVNSIINQNGILPQYIKYKSRFLYNDILRIVQVSRIDIPKKGQDILIESVNLLIKKGYTNLKVDFIGDGSSMNYLKEIVKDYGVENYINFLGAKSQEYIFNHLCDYDLFVQPSRFEGFGLTVAEAMAAKLPVLVSDNQGPAEIVGHGEYGYIFESENIEDCANKIEIFIKKENDLSMIEKAYKRVNEIYNIKKTAQNYINQYIHK